MCHGSNLTQGCRALSLAAVSVYLCLACLPCLPLGVEIGIIGGKCSDPSRLLNNKCKLTCYQVSCLALHVAGFKSHRGQSGFFLFWFAPLVVPFTNVTGCIFALSCTRTCTSIALCVRVYVYIHCSSSCCGGLYTVRGIAHFPNEREALITFSCGVIAFLSDIRVY